MVVLYTKNYWKGSDLLELFENVFKQYTHGTALMPDIIVKTANRRNGVKHKSLISIDAI